MTSPKIIEAWFTLMSEAMRGNSGAQEAMRALTSTTTTSTDHLHSWMGQFMPAAMRSMSGGAQPERFGEWLEEWWRMMGVVPRYRYLDLLERHENLRLRLEECEKARQEKGLMGMAGAQEETQRAMNLWGSMIDTMLKTQSEMMRNFLPRDETTETTPEQQEDTPGGGET